MNDTVAQRLAELRREYARTLPDRTAAVRAGWQALRQARDRSRTQAELVRIVHGLCGSGGSFGCEALSTAAHRLEDFLKACPPDTPHDIENAEFERLFFDVEHAARDCCMQLNATL